MGIEDAAIWREAKANGIILVPFAPWKEGAPIMAAAIHEELLEVLMVQLELDPESWDDIYGLGLGFFVETAAPGNGPDRAAAYQEALRTYEKLDMETKSVAIVAKFKTEKADE